MQDHSRAPRSCPHQTSDTIVQLILDEHARFGWGARKIIKRLQRRDPRGPWPARSTIFEIRARTATVKTAMLAEARRDPAWAVLRSIPFLGPVRVALLLATMQSIPLARPAVAEALV